MVNAATGRWDEAKTEILQKMARDGKSAAQIGMVLYMTRSAVMGKAHREGIKLSGGASPSHGGARKGTGNRHQPKTTQLSVRLTPNNLKFGEPVSAVKTDPVHLTMAEPAVIVGVEFMERTERQCVFPLWPQRPGQLCCGLPIPKEHKDVTARSQYCAFHATACTVQPSSRRSEAQRPYFDKDRYADNLYRHR